MGDTPNFLGFLQEAPKESPLERGIRGALQTYGDVQSLIQQTYKTRAMPKDIEQGQALKGQEIQKGGLELQYLPEQLEQEAKTRQLMVDALPKDISLRQSGAGLENAYKGLRNQAESASVDELHNQIAENELAKLYQTKINFPDQLQSQYKASRKTLIAHGADPETLPAELNDDILDRAHMSYSTQQDKALLPLKNELAKIALQNKGKVDAEAAKQASAQQFSIDKDTQKASTKFFEEELPSSSGIGFDTQQTAQDMRRQVQKHEWVYSTSPLTGGLLALGAKYKMPSVNQAAADSAELQLAKLAATPGASRGTKALLNKVAESKVSIYDPPEAIYNKLDKFETAGIIASEYSNFANLMKQNGIISKGQIQNSWDKFIEARTYIDKDGKYHPGESRNWRKYYQQHPDDLPEGIKQKTTDSQKLNQGISSAASLPLSDKQKSSLNNIFPNVSQITQEQQNKIQGLAPSKPTGNVATNEGLISDFNPSSVLTGE